MKARRSILLALCLLLCTASSSARAAVKTFNVTGEVLPGASAVLAPYGVQTGATVKVSWSVELATPPFAVSGPPDNKTDYCGAISFILIEIGTWTAFKVAPVLPCQNGIAVADDSGGVLDLLHIVTPGLDNDLVLHTNQPGGFLLLSLDFYGFTSAGSNQSLDQDPSRYYSGVGSAQGPGGRVDFTIETSGSGGGGGPVDPTASCRKAQLKAGAKLCKSELACHAKYAKNPAADQSGAYREMCLAKAEDKFTSAYDAAALKAADKELACGTSAPASEPLAAITGQVDAILAEVDAIQPGYAPLESAWLSAAGAACFSSVGAQSANAGKPDPDKLATAVEKAALKLDTAAQKAAAKAADKGVVFVPPLDIPAFHEAVDEAIDTATSELNGD